MTNLYTNKETFKTYRQAEANAERWSEMIEQGKELGKDTSFYEEQLNEIKTRVENGEYHTELFNLRVVNQDGKLIEERSNEFDRNPFQSIIGYMGMNGKGGESYTVLRSSILDTYKVDEELTEVFNMLFGGAR